MTLACSIACFTSLLSISASKRLTCSRQGFCLEMNPSGERPSDGGYRVGWAIFIVQANAPHRRDALASLMKRKNHASEQPRQRHGKGLAPNELTKRGAVDFDHFDRGRRGWW